MHLLWSFTATVSSVYWSTCQRGIMLTLYIYRRTNG